MDLDALLLERLARLSPMERRWLRPRVRRWWMTRRHEDIAEIIALIEQRERRRG